MKIEIVFFSAAIFQAIFKRLNGGPLIELRHVDVCLDRRRILSDITWTLARGQSWMVLGVNGAGKSTFLRLLRAEIAPAPGRGRRIYNLDGRAQRTAVGVKERIALVSPEAQDRYLQLEWNLHARDVIYSGFAGTDYLYQQPTIAQRRWAARLIKLLAIEPLLGRNVQELSTGELRRVLIARALAGRPQILLLDEVCDGLDAFTRRRLLGFVDRIVQAGTQVVYTTHRQEELLPLTHALVLDKGRITSAEALTQRDRALRHPRPWPPVAKGSTRAHGAASGGDRSPLFRLERANVFLNRKHVLRDITWEMRSGENWAIFGANGAGKSTFLKLLAGDLHAASDSLVQRFEFTPRHTLWELRRRIGYLSPVLQATYREDLTTIDVIASGFFSSIGLMARVSQSQRRQAQKLMRQFGLFTLHRRPATRLSYGEFRKILLLRALVHEPQVLVCDEPFDGLDAASRKEFSMVLDHVPRIGTRLVTVTHHLDDLPSSITHGLVLENGRVVCEGEIGNVREHPAMTRLFGGHE